MARARAFPAALLLFLLLVAAGEMTGTTKMAEAGRTCATPSSRFKFLCFSDRNCRSVCNSEGFPGGDCHGFRRRCYCTKPC